MRSLSRINQEKYVAPRAMKRVRLTALELENDLPNVRC